MEMENVQNDCVEPSTILHPSYVTSLACLVSPTFTNPNPTFPIFTTPTSPSLTTPTSTSFATPKFTIIDAPLFSSPISMAHVDNLIDLSDKTDSVTSGENGSGEHGNVANSLWSSAMPMNTDECEPLCIYEALRQMDVLMDGTEQECNDEHDNGAFVNSASANTSPCTSEGPLLSLQNAFQQRQCWGLHQVSLNPNNIWRYFRAVAVLRQLLLIWDNAIVRHWDSNKPFQVNCDIIRPFIENDPILKRHLPLLPIVTRFLNSQDLQHRQYQDNIYTINYLNVPPSSDAFECPLLDVLYHQRLAVPDQHQKRDLLDLVGLAQSQFYAILYERDLMIRTVLERDGDPCPAVLDVIHDPDYEPFTCQYCVLQRAGIETHIVPCLSCEKYNYYDEEIPIFNTLAFKTVLAARTPKSR